MNIIKTLKAFARFLINFNQIQQHMDDSIVLINPWEDFFLDLVKKSQKTIDISSPFISEYAINKLLDNKPIQSNLRIITNFNINNIINNSLELSSLKKIFLANSSIKSNSLLHAKIYIFNQQEIIISSANLSFGGLVKNFEYGFYSKNPQIARQVLNDFNDIYNNQNTFEITQDNLDIAENIVNDRKLSDNNFIKNPHNLIADSFIIPHLTGWKKELFLIINQNLPTEFSIDQLYQFHNDLKKIFPQNHHIDDKIRQTLQFLRNDGLIEFLNFGNYKKNWLTLT